MPTARRLSVARAPCVVKADGLAAGKGVWVCRTEADLAAGLAAAEALGQPFHVEELLEGDEVSAFALCDGERALPLPAAQDYKRIRDGDQGANTGGMGSYSPVPRLSERDVAELVDQVCTPVLRELAQRQTDLNDRLKELQSALEAAKDQLPAEQRAGVERTVARLRAQQERARTLSEVRAKWGDAAVDTVLTREKAVLDLWGVPAR